MTVQHVTDDILEYTKRNAYRAVVPSTEASCAMILVLPRTYLSAGAPGKRSKAPLTCN